MGISHQNGCEGICTVEKYKYIKAINWLKQGRRPLLECEMNRGKIIQTTLSLGSYWNSWCNVTLSFQADKHKKSKKKSIQEILSYTQFFKSRDSLHMTLLTIFTLIKYKPISHPQWLLGASAFIQWTLILALRWLTKSTSVVLRPGSWLCKWDTLP